MKRLALKFSFYYLGYTVLVVGTMFPLMNHDRLTGPDPLSLNFVFTLVPSLFMAVLGGLWTHELAEHKAGGYDFLDLLPLSAVDIVGAKFLLILMSTLGFVGFHWAALSMISRNRDYLIPSRNYLFFHGGLCLILAGLAYAGIYRFGFQRIGKFILLTYLVSIILPIPLTTIILPKIALSRLDVIDAIARVHPLVSTLVGLSAYGFLFKLAVGLKRQNFK